MGIIKSKFKKMEEFDCSMDDMDGKYEEHQGSDPRSPTSAISRTPLNDVRAKSSLITRVTNLANISTPINNDLMMIQDKRFKHLAHSFIDPRSPSEGIVRTPIVMKSSEISSIMNTPRILEEELNEQEEEEQEDFQKTFEERLSRLSFDCLEQEEEKAKLPQLVETHFDDGCLLSQPVPPMTLATNLVAQSTFDPRSPSIGIERTPLVFAEERQQPVPNLQPTRPTFADQLKTFEKEQTKEEEGENEETAKNDDNSEETAVSTEGTKEAQPTIVEPTEQTEQPSSEVFVEVGRVIYGTPVQIASSGGPIQQVRTPLSCLANRKRTGLNGKAAAGKSSANSNLGKKQLKPQVKDINVCGELKAKKTANNPFENNTPRKAIR